MSQAQRPPPPGSMVLKSNPSIILLCSFLPSDYIIEEKTAVLQKREHEGFGFVLRGAKGKGCFFHLVLGLGGKAPSPCFGWCSGPHFPGCTPQPASPCALGSLRGLSSSLAARQYECSLSLVTCIVQKMPFVANVHLSHFLGCFSGTDAGIRSFAFVGVFTSAWLLGV